MLSNEQAALLIKYYQTICLSEEQQERLCCKYWDASPVERAEIARVYAHLFAKDALFIQRLLRHHDERRQRVYEYEQEQHKQERQRKQNRLRTQHSPETSSSTTPVTAAATSSKVKDHVAEVISISDSYNSNMEYQEEENATIDGVEKRNIAKQDNFISRISDKCDNCLHINDKNSNKEDDNNVAVEESNNDTTNAMQIVKRYKLETKMHNIDSDEPSSPLSSEMLLHKNTNYTTRNATNANADDTIESHEDLINLSDCVASPTLSTSTVNSFDKQEVQSPLSPRTNSTGSDESNEELYDTQASQSTRELQFTNKPQREFCGNGKSVNSSPTAMFTSTTRTNLHSSPTLRLSHSQLLTRTAIQDQFPKLIGDGPFCIAFRLVQSEEERRAVIDLYASQFSHPDPPELQRLVMLPQSVSTRTRRRVTGSCTWFIECITTHEIVCAVTVTAHHHKIHHFVEMPLFATAAGYKRNGFGRLLNAALASWCARAGFEFTMVSADAQAIAFWEHLGYVRMSRREKQQIAFYYEHECYKFKKAQPMIGYCTWRELGAQGKSGLEPLCNQKVEAVLQKMHRFVMIGPLELPNP